MKTFMPALSFYIVACATVIFMPASFGYDALGWKLFVAQIYAIPIFIIALAITVLIQKKRDDHINE